jgi:hypothetical protein
MSHARGTLRLAAASMDRARTTEGDARGLALVMAVLALVCAEPRKVLPMERMWL